MTIYNGRESFYQWDLNQKVTSETFQVGDKIHFYSLRHPTALATKAYALDGKVVADVPNILLQTTNPIKIYRYISNPTSAQTVDEETFVVKQKPQPSDYFYTETELYELRSDVEKSVSELDEIKTSLNLAEQSRAMSEDERVTNEDNRVIAEASRVNAENKRESDESIRKTNETSRKSAETKRVNAEQSRETNEQNRVSAEQERAEAERVRQATYDTLPNNIGNALKGVASGEVVRVDDVSPVEHLVKAKVSENNLDSTTVTVTRCGKNVFNVNSITTSSSLVNNGDGTLTVNTLVAQPIQQLKELCPSLKAGCVATFSFVSPATDATKTTNNKFDYIYLMGAKESWRNNTSKTITQEMLDGGIYFYASKGSEGNAVATIISNIQIEIGATVTKYEAYSGTTHTPSADGTVDIASLSPTMTLLTDTEGVTIELEYNKDANLVIAGMQSQIDELRALITKSQT